MGPGAGLAPESGVMNAPAQATAFPQFIAAGEALIDLIVQPGSSDQWTSRCGGATWNVARVLAAQGIPSAFAGAISQDAFGEALWQASAHAGLDLRFLQRVARSPLLAVVHALQPPQYFFVGDDSADLHFSVVTLPAGWQANCGWAHFGGISLTREPLAGTLVALASDLKRKGWRISFDPNFRNVMDSRFDSTLRTMVQLADVIKVSDEDLSGLFRTADTQAALDTLRRWNPLACVLLTRGAEGARLHLRTSCWQARPPPVTVVDTVGAGDASMGGLIASLLRHPQADPADHLRAAVAAGAVACTVSGAHPPSNAQVQALAPKVTVQSDMG